MKSYVLLSCLVLLLTACGNTASPEATAPASAPAALPTAAAAPNPAIRSGQIRGTVTVPPYAAGRAYVAAATRLDGLLTGRVAGVVPIEADGAFVLEYLPPDTYYVAAFIDGNGNARFDGPEPYVAWPAPLTVDGTTPATGIALHNFLNLADPAVRTAERTARVLALGTAAEEAFRELRQAHVPDTADPAHLLPTLRVMLWECTRLWETAADEETWEFIEGTLAAMPGLVEAAQRGEDPLAAQRGWCLRGFVRARDKAIVPYFVYVPPTYDPATPLPAVLGLHGGGGSHWAGPRMVAQGEGLDAFSPGRLAGLGLRDVGVNMFIVTPSGDRSGSLVPWQGPGEANAMGALEEVRRRFAIDPNRVYLTGMSDGGRGAWEIGARFPDRFAAILIGAGATDAMLPLVMNVAHIPIRVVHGAHDQIIPVQNSRNIVEAGRQYNARIEYDEVDRGHDVTDLLYREEVGLRWLSQFRRTPVPPLVRYRTENVLHGEGAGVVITALGTPGRLADIRVAWTSSAEVHVASRNVAAFTLRVPPGTADTITVHWNGQDLRVAGRPGGIHLTATATETGGVEWAAAAAPAPDHAPGDMWVARELG